MYMHGLAALGLSQRELEFYSSGQWSGDDPLLCESRGGTPNSSYTQYDPSGFGVPPVRFFCKQPMIVSGGGGAPVTVTVPTTVQTNVNPQVSPTFVQQDEPTNSGIGTNTQQDAASPQSVSYEAMADVLRQLAAGGAGASAPAMTFDAGSGTIPPAVIAGARPKWTEIAVAAAAILGAAIALKKSNGKRSAKSRRRK